MRYRVHQAFEPSKLWILRYHPKASVGTQVLKLSKHAPDKSRGAINGLGYRSVECDILHHV